MPGQYHTKPADLAFFNGKDWVVLELKAGSDLDSSNVLSNVEKLLTIYIGMNVLNCKAYFSSSENGFFSWFFLVLINLSVTILLIK